MQDMLQPGGIRPRGAHVVLARLLREVPRRLGRPELGPGHPGGGCAERRAGAGTAMPDVQRRARGRGQGGAPPDAAPGVEAPRTRPGAMPAARQHVVRVARRPLRGVRAPHKLRIAPQRTGLRSEQRTGERGGAQEPRQRQVHRPRLQGSNPALLQSHISRARCRVLLR